MNTNYIINSNGTEIDFETAVNYMDDEIREDLHGELSPCTEQEFFNAYCERHFKKYSEAFEFDKDNPNV